VIPVYDPVTGSLGCSLHVSFSPQLSASLMEVAEMTPADLPTEQLAKLEGMFYQLLLQALIPSIAQAWIGRHAAEFGIDPATGQVDPGRIDGDQLAEAGGFGPHHLQVAVSPLPELAEEEEAAIPTPPPAPTEAELAAQIETFEAELKAHGADSLEGKFAARQLRKLKDR
jgi:hypothetical protein